MRSSLPAIVVSSCWLLLACSDFSLEPSGGQSTEPVEHLTHVRDDWLLSETEALEWHALKDEKGPALTGNASWLHFIGFVEDRLGEYGVVDIQRNQWTFDRWRSSEWPDRSNWALVSNGRQVEVASYGANSGATGPDGVTARLVFYDQRNPPDDIAGKIVIFSTAVDEAAIEAFANSDFEYRSDDESFPERGGPIPVNRPDRQGTSIFLQLMGLQSLIDIAIRGNAVGIVFVLDAGRDLAAGMYTFPVPRIYDVPSLYLDRTAGMSVIEDAKAGARATLRLEATITESTAYQLIGYLPGNKYGTPDDEQIQLVTHTDGPSISQDNGAFGILGVIKYMSRIPQADRPRTLMVFLDCRHFMPGAERAFAAQDWFTRNPDARDAIVAMIGMEHLGQIEYREDGDALVESGRVYASHIWTTDSSNMVKLAVQAVTDNNLPSAFVRNVARPGVHGRSQGRWYGMAKSAPALKIPGVAIMGIMGAYWGTSSGIDRFDASLFRQQVATFVQLTGELMIADLAELTSVEDPGGLRADEEPAGRGL
ncbi:MAG: hypothetical protein GTO71_09560 [Woeseiaceae bacterium]|nr:hypothetical protein [Woeseiaceae bacterium]NIP21333.1 hypothetical protein [Woeseiaceae bacterium]NIS90300.1 hypothetical protein [Woeseiaceae bacterium]